MADQPFKQGAKIEISSDEHGYRGAWFTGTVIKPPEGPKVLVEYDTLFTDKSGKKRMRENVKLVQIRPVPPRETSWVFKLNEEVDAFYNDGWWEGVVTEVHEGSKYSLYFRCSGEQLEFEPSELRLHREWVYGNWVPPLEDEGGREEKSSVTEETQPNQEMEKETLREGSIVEVTSDEDGFQGAWFAAKVVRIIGKDKFLVQYRDLKTDDDSAFVQEEVDALHIRPCPPDTPKIDKFKLYDEVDTLYKDGWWVGVISKVLSNSSYMVFFKDSGEEMEFQLSDLRLHQDWINGKWVTASQALGNSD